MKSIYILTSILFLGINANSQSWNCETEEPIEDFLFQTNQVTSYRSTLSDYTFKIYYHIVRRSDGKDGISPTLVNLGHSILNSDFSSGNISFFSIGIGYIDSDYYFNFQLNKFNQLINQNTQSNALNVYIVPGTNGEFGRASGIPGNSMVVSQSYFLNSVNSHEIEHLLGLYHTHSGRGITFVQLSEN